MTQDGYERTAQAPRTGDQATVDKVFDMVGSNPFTVSHAAVEAARLIYNRVLAERSALAKLESCSCTSCRYARRMLKSCADRTVRNQKGGGR